MQTTCSPINLFSHSSLPPSIQPKPLSTKPNSNFFLKPCDRIVAVTTLGPQTVSLLTALSSSVRPAPLKRKASQIHKHRLSSAGPTYLSVQLMTIRHCSLNHTPAPPTLQTSLNTPCCHRPQKSFPTCLIPPCPPPPFHPSTKPLCRLLYKQDR